MFKRRPSALYGVQRKCTYALVLFTSRGIRRDRRFLPGLLGATPLKPPSQPLTLIIICRVLLRQSDLGAEFQLGWMDDESLRS